MTSESSFFPPNGIKLVDGVISTEEYRVHLDGLLNGYEQSGLAPPNLRDEVMAGCGNPQQKQKLWACVWEAMLYRHFYTKGFQFRTDRARKSGQHGPDLGLISGNKTIWVEAVVPTSEGLPDEWIRPPGGMNAREYPHEAMLLRLTSVISEKHKQYQARLSKGVVDRDEPYVVAVNTYLLSGHPVQGKLNARPPYAVAAVYPVGDPRCTFYPNSTNFERQSRDSIIKRNGAAVQTTSFLDCEYEGISALIQGSVNNMLDGSLALIAVHNVCARNRIEARELGVGQEIIPEEDKNGSIKIDF